MGKYLLLFTFSPVQPFISQGRKTQDIYAGSFILSYLCKKIFQEAESLYNAETIFPSPFTESYPNRYLAILNASQGDLREIGEFLEKKLKKSFVKIGTSILDKLNVPLPVSFIEQLDNYLECQWVLEEIINGDYRSAYNAAERHLGATKNIRRFEQISEAEGRKCSLTGEHNVLFYRGQKRRYVYSALQLPISRDAPLKFLQDGEGLGAIGFMKRFAELFFADHENKFQTDFPSTSEVALFDAFEQVRALDPALIEEIEKEKSNFDIQVLFDVYHNRETIGSLNMVQLERANKFCQIARKNDINLSSYYAILIFDGDDMGKVLSGERIGNGLPLEKYQKELSAILGQYAQRTAEILKKPKGAIVYAGGDDFLGFVNLQYLFQVMEELRQEFEQLPFFHKMEKPVTFSAGVAVAHYKIPLNMVINWARVMQTEAKSYDAGKNAFGLAVLKHSGEVEKSVYRWKCGDKWTTSLISSLIEKLSGSFSDTFIRNINLEFRKLLDENGAVIPSVVQDALKMKSRQLKTGIVTETRMISSEFKRLAGRSLLKERAKNKDEKQREIVEMVELLNQLFRGKRTFTDFLSLLNIASFMVRKGKKE